MKVALIFAKVEPESEPILLKLRMENPGLQYLSSACAAAGHETVIIDQHCLGLTDEDVLSRLEAFRPDLIGLSVVNPNLGSSLELAAEIKRRRETPIVVGGCYPTTHPEIVKEPDIDIAVLGEGEVTLVELAHRMEGELPWHDMEGTASLRGGEAVVAPPRAAIEDIDTIPFADRRFYDLSRLDFPFYFPGGWGRQGLVSVVTSRGCAFRCGFCISPLMWGGRWRGRSPANVVEELVQINQTFGARKYFFADEEINTDRARALELYRAISEADLDLAWSAMTSVRCTDIEVAEAMVDAGLKSVLLGFESGSPEILKRLGKGYELADGRSLVRYLHKRGVFTMGSFMFGLPWETRETIRETISYAASLDLGICNGWLYRPQPGSTFYSFGVAKGLLDHRRYDELEYKHFEAPTRSLSLSRKEIERAVLRFMFVVNMRPTLWIRILARVLRWPSHLRCYCQFGLVVIASGLVGVLRKVGGMPAKALRRSQPR